MELGNQQEGRELGSDHGAKELTRSQEASKEHGAWEPTRSQGARKLGNQ